MPRVPRVLRGSQLAGDGVVHGFTTRRGGVSAGPFAELNFSPKWPEEAEAVAANVRLLAEEAGFDPEALYLARQVHRTAGLLADELSPGQARSQEADYLVASRPGITVAVLTADCVPVLLVDPERPAVAAVHCGWRGLVADILAVAIADLGRRFGSRPGSLRAVLGPSIGPCCFEVGPEVADQFAARLPAAADEVVRDPGRPGGTRPHVDLWRAARAMLAEAGVDPERTEVTQACTHCEPERFHSYRRDGARVGQHLSFVGVAPGGAS